LADGGKIFLVMFVTGRLALFLTVAVAAAGVGACAANAPRSSASTTRTQASSTSVRSSASTTSVRSSVTTTSPRSSASTTSMRSSSTTTTNSTSRCIRARIGGRIECLAVGRRCRPKYNTIYASYGFVCKRAKDGTYRLRERIFEGPPNPGTSG
jgi:type IV secretory pathway TrbL component